MPELCLSVLGPFGATLDGRSLGRFRTKAVKALLVYLACQPETVQRREHLMALLWPGLPQRSAQANLRQALYLLRQAIPAVAGRGGGEPVPWLLADRQTVQVNPAAKYELDVQRFTDLLDKDESQWPAAVALYRGDFLADFYLPDSAAFEAWTLARREELRRKMLEALERLAARALAVGDLAAAETYARRQLAMDDLREGAHRQLMAALAESGRRVEALNHYEGLVEQLWQEVGLDPADETELLAEQIRTGEPLGLIGERMPYGLPVEEEIPSKLPEAATPFVGRQAELEQVEHLLEGHRLVTISGPGGSGKTRLALEAAARQARALRLASPQAKTQFPDGVFFVALEALESPDDILPALIQALGFQPMGQYARGRTLRQQVLDYLRNKQLLLVLDNFEQLLAGTELVLALLEAAPGVKLLVTSRERLSLRNEQLLPLRGLDYPEQMLAQGATDSNLDYDAAHLFLQTARSVEPGFQVGDEEASLVLRVCRLVDGLPLALELAAGWVEMLSLADIAGEIERDLGILQRDLRDLPRRHRSMEAVFQRTWQHLELAEKKLFRELSIFRGGFTLEAAQAICGAPLFQLAALNKKSLLRHDREQGRYRMHRLLRQYGARLLAEDEATHKQIRERHCTYYCQLLEGWGQEIKGAGQLEAIRQLDHEMPNAQLALEAALENLPEGADEGPVTLEQLAQSIEALCLYFQWKYQPDELERICRKAAEKLALRSDAEAKRALGKILSWQGLYMEDEDDQRLLERSLALLQEAEEEGLDVKWAKVFALSRQGDLVLSTGRARSLKYLEEALELYEELDDDWGKAFVLGRLAWIAHWSGRYREAASYCRRQLSLHRTLGDRMGMAETFSLLAQSIGETGDLEEAERIILHNIELSQELDAPKWLMRSYENLGFILWHRGRFAEARNAFETSQKVKANLGLAYVDEPYITNVYAFVLAQEGQYERAYALCKEVSQQTDQDRDPIGYAIFSWVRGALCLCLEKQEEAMEWLENSITSFGSINVVYFPTGTNAALTMAEPTFEHVSQTIQEAHAEGSFMAHMMALPAVAFYFLNQGELERALELYALASRYPTVGNSRWYDDLVGRPLREAAAAFPGEAVEEARSRGRAREVEATLAELAAEFGEASE